MKKEPRDNLTRIFMIEECFRKISELYSLYEDIKKQIKNHKLKKERARNEEIYLADTLCKCMDRLIFNVSNDLNTMISFSDAIQEGINEIIDFSESTSDADWIEKKRLREKARKEILNDIEY